MALLRRTLSGSATFGRSACHCQPRLRRAALREIPRLHGLGRGRPTQGYAPQFPPRGHRLVDRLRSGTAENRQSDVCVTDDGVRRSPSDRSHHLFHPCKRQPLIIFPELTEQPRGPCPYPRTPDLSSAARACLLTTGKAEIVPSRADTHDQPTAGKGIKCREDFRRHPVRHINQNNACKLPADGLAALQKPITSPMIGCRKRPFWHLLRSGRVPDGQEMAQFRHSASRARVRRKNSARWAQNRGRRTALIFRKKSEKLDPTGAQDKNS